METMFCAVGPAPGGVAVLAHPDHLRRVYRTVQTRMATLEPTAPCARSVASSLPS
jgi:hypothetical protein